MTSPIWNIDPAHSSVLFQSRHLVIARVNGRFDRMAGLLKFSPEALHESSVEIEIDAASINTNNADRDTHLRSAEFLNVAAAPKLSFQSTKVEAVNGGTFRLAGQATIRNVTRPVTMECRMLGVMTKDPWGTRRALFSAKLSLNRSEFGISWNKVLDNGGWVVSEKIDIEIDIQAVAAAAG